MSPDDPYIVDEDSDVPAGEESDLPFDEEDLESVKGSGLVATVGRIWDTLSKANDYGYSLLGNPAAYIISTIAGLIVGALFGLGEYLVDFIVALSWPYEMLIEFLVDTVVNLGLPAGEWVLVMIREANAVLRELALEAGVAAPFVVLGAYLLIGGAAYIAFTRFVPYGRVIGIARRVI